MTDATTQEEKVRRPLAVWVVVALGLVQGFAALGAAAIILWARSNADLMDLLTHEDPQLTDRELLVTGLTVGTVGLVNTTFAVLLARGNRTVRAIYAAIATIEVAAATYGLVAVEDIRAAALAALAYPVAILWLLYGSEKSVRFFDR